MAAKRRRHQLDREDVLEMLRPLLLKWLDGTARWALTTDVALLALIEWWNPPWLVPTLAQVHREMVESTAEALGVDLEVFLAFEESRHPPGLPPHSSNKVAGRRRKGHRVYRPVVIPWNDKLPRH